MKNDTLLHLHNRLLAGDPTASAEIVEQLLKPLKDNLVRAYPKVDETMVTDAVEDALLNYIRRPGQFDPGKRTLMGYLQMAARGDLLNALSALRKRRRRENTVENVEELLDGRNNRMDRPYVGVDIDGIDIGQTARATFSDPLDKKLLELITNGVRATAAYAEVLDIGSLSIEEQRKVVKRHKDRILKRLARLMRMIRE